MQRLVLASNNDGKLREFRRLLAPLGIDVDPAGRRSASPRRTSRTSRSSRTRWRRRGTRARSRSCPRSPTTPASACRARRRARRAISARYAGEPKSDARNNAKLVAALRGVADRRAHYACVLVLVRHATDPEPMIAEGQWHGRIVDVPRGRGGFGYDPHFEDPATGLTGAELPLERKNELSHRGKAMRALIALLHDRRTVRTGACPRTP